MLGFPSFINSATATTANLRSVNDNLVVIHNQAWFYFLILKPLLLKVTGATFIFKLLFYFFVAPLHVGFIVEKYLTKHLFLFPCDFPGVALYTLLFFLPPSILFLENIIHINYHQL